MIDDELFARIEELSRKLGRIEAIIDELEKSTVTKCGKTLIRQIRELLK